jgi:hypothetical protein
MGKPVGFARGDKVRIKNLGGAGPAEAVVAQTYMGIGNVSVNVLSGAFAGSTTSVKPESLIPCK